MHKRKSFFNTINARILLVLLVLFAAIAGAVGEVNNRNIRKLYENTYTERLLLTNALMGTFISSQNIEFFVELMKNQDAEFKQQQVEFYHDREELFRLQEEGASEEEQQSILQRLAEFHSQTQALKNEDYWNTLAELKNLKEVSHSTYVYVMADTGLKTRNGEALYTYIFDAEDAGEYSSPDMDGLGTSDIGNEAFNNVFLTKKQTERAEHYIGDFGELYFVCVPILNENGDVIAILGTDLSLDDMNGAIASSTSLFNSIIISIFIASVIVIFFLLSRSIAKPLSSLTDTALAFAEGNLHTPISQFALRQNTEIGTLAHAFKSTLDATTLYLNSVPECLFIMNRNLETYFRNEQFIKRFGDMQASEFVGALFPTDSKGELLKSLACESNTSTVWINDSCFAVLLKEIAITNMPETSILVIANDITDLMREKENAQAAAAAKSAFLSRMSHEMRTPMNAILGMTKVADSSDNISNLKHCISTINASSVQLLSIINDVLDMSKIEAGRLELENAPMNLEKTLINVCKTVIGEIEKKKQKLDIVLSERLELNYIADELRLSQVLTNLLSNAVKFTPEGGAITLTIDNADKRDNSSVLRFSVSDTGIGMTDGEIERLFNAFEQADGSNVRRFGGVGLGLAISQSIVEKMGGHIDVKSEPGAGSTFCFAVAFETVPDQDTGIVGGIRPEDIRLLIIENDDDLRKHVSSVVMELGIHADTAGTAQEAAAHLDAACKTDCAYDVIFLSFELPDSCGISIINHYGDKIDRASVVLLTAYLEWHRIEKCAHENNIAQFIVKPIFPMSVLSVINSVLRQKLSSLETKADAEEETPDFSDVKVLLVEDIEINREVFLALMEDTNISTDIAENGVEAVSKFKENPELYDIIFMDIQMPEMDGYEATKTIRAIGTPRARSVPIVAMSANAFKEDIDRCLDSGMNGHLAKPIDLEPVIETILSYTRTV